MEVAGEDASILANAALALAYFGEDIGAMTASVDRALALNPNSARGWHMSGILRMYAGQPDIAIEHIETSLRLSPRTRTGSSLVVIGAAHFVVSRRFDGAVPKLLLAIQEDPNDANPHRFLAACYAHMGRLDEARATIARLRITPQVVPGDLPLRNPSTANYCCPGCALRRARRHDNGAPPRGLSVTSMRGPSRPSRQPTTGVSIAGHSCGGYRTKLSARRLHETTPRKA